MTIRGEMLDRAKTLTEGDRNASYGDPYINMLAFADLIEGYLRARGVEFTVTAEDAAWIMVLAKLARCHDPKLPFHLDNYTDAAAYAAMAGECAKREREE